MVKCKKRINTMCIFKATHLRLGRFVCFFVQYYTIYYFLKSSLSAGDRQCYSSVNQMLDFCYKYLFFFSLLLKSSDLNEDVWILIVCLFGG